MMRPGTGGTTSSAYCYSVWLRHLKHLYGNGLVSDIAQIKTVAEIGPGDSLGIGMSALYSGASNYLAFDVIRHAFSERNLEVNDDLLQLFLAKTPVPHGKGFERTAPTLDDYSFPSEILKYDLDQYRETNVEISKALSGEDADLRIE